MQDVRNHRGAPLYSGPFTEQRLCLYELYFFVSDFFDKLCGDVQDAAFYIKQALHYRPKIRVKPVSSYTAL